MGKYTDGFVFGYLSYDIYLISQAFAKDLAQEEPIYDEIVMAANNVLDNLESPEERQALSDKLEGLIHLWKKTHDDLDSRKSELNDVYGAAKALEDKENDLDRWLEATEKKLNYMKPVSCVPNELEMQRKEANVSYCYCVQNYDCID